MNCSKCGKDMQEEDKYCGECGNISDFIDINLKIASAIFLIIGTLYIIIGSISYNETWNEWAIVMIVEGVIFNAIGYSLIIKQILPKTKTLNCFILGTVTGLLGIIVAVIIKYKKFLPKRKYKFNKYEDLERLQKLKEQGAITEEEFETEKNKLLK